ncbi:hypothetical protein ACFL2R_02760 [Patescibacteria group bacterium]
MDMEKGDEEIKLNIHPLLKIFKGDISFFIVSQLMVAMPAFQQSIIREFDGKPGEVSTSVDLNGNVLKFDVEHILNEFNGKFGVSEESGKVRASFGEAFNQHGRLMVIALFDVLSNSRYNKKINRTEIFKFVKHLRNGSSHKNKFNFEGKAIKDVEWRGKMVTQSEEGKDLFGRFIHLPDLLILINDISNELDVIDRRNQLEKEARKRF